MLNSSEESKVFQLVKSLASKSVIQHTYSLKAEVLSSIFCPVQLKTGVHHVDAQCHVSTVIQKTMTDNQSVNFTHIEQSILHTVFIHRSGITL